MKGKKTSIFFLCRRALPLAQPGPRGPKVGPADLSKISPHMDTGLKKTVVGDQIGSPRFLLRRFEQVIRKMSYVSYDDM